MSPCCRRYAYSSASSFFAEHAKRRAILQLGDSLTDVDPARHVPYEHLLSVGFVNERPDPTKHHETFDAVVHGNQGSLLPVTDLLEEIAPQQVSVNFIRALSGASLQSLSLPGSALSLQNFMSMATFPNSPTAPAA